MYFRPNTLSEAVNLLAASGGKVLAGGTDVFPSLGDAPLTGTVVDISALRELRGISEDDQYFRIGGLTTWTDIALKRLPRCFDALKAAAHEIGGVQIQNRGTVAGNLCNASPAADSVPALVAAGAVVTIQGPKARRQVPVEKFAAGPGKTTLKPGEIVVSLTLPARPRGAGDAYLRLIPRTEMDIAVVGCGVSLVMKGDTCVSARVGLGAVAPTVLLVEAAGKALTGSKLDDAALDAAANACSAACRPIDDKRGTIRYRTKIAGVLLRRATAIARDRANGISHQAH